MTDVASVPQMGKVIIFPVRYHGKKASSRLHPQVRRWMKLFALMMMVVVIDWFESLQRSYIYVHYLLTWPQRLIRRWINVSIGRSPASNILSSNG